MKKKKYITFQEKYDREGNSMDILRLFLAITVIYGHTFPVLYGAKLISPTGNFDILAMFSKNQVGSGTIAVYMFFIISGFLITQSIINSKNIFEYIIKRILRLMPALFGSLFFTVFVIGIISTDLSLTNYFYNIGNPIKYFLSNLSFGIFGFYYSLADVFSTNPLPGSINASMWTLPFEVAFYLLIILFSINNFFKKKQRIIYAYIVSLILVYYKIRFGYIPSTLNDNFWIISANQIGGFITLGYYFIAGSLIY